MSVLSEESANVEMATRGQSTGLDNIARDSKTEHRSLAFSTQRSTSIPSHKSIRLVVRRILPIVLEVYDLIESWRGLMTSYGLVVLYTINLSAKSHITLLRYVTSRYFGYRLSIFLVVLR